MNLSEAEEIFHLALETEGARERALYLDSACAGKPALRAQIELLLAAHNTPPGFLETVPETPLVRVGASTDECPGSQIGRYKLLERLGEGGCGVVYVAEQTEPVRRRVALKVIKLGMDTKAVVARFEAERQALAMMDHPNIAKVLDAGTTDAGRPYFVMELVRGTRITDYCDQNNLRTAERIDLFVKVCQAIQHAHQKGIIHRDIKPSNILVTLHDGVPVPKVIDFGIAKATEGRLTDATVYTQLHQFIGTPAYMSPEQAEMSGLDIDTRSDIYSLGVLLYELLTGRTPFDPKELMKQGLDEMRRTIREREPARPSTRLATLQGQELTTTAQQRSVDSAKLLCQLQGDLDWIVMKSLDKDRTRRYETASGLAADLNRYLTNEPVTARPPSAIYKLHKAWRRNRLLYSAAAAIAVALLAGAVVSYLQAHRARKAESLAKARLLDVQKERDAKEEARQNAEQVSQFLQQIFQSPDPARDGRKITVAETLDRATKQLDSDLANQPERRARLQATLADTYAALGLTAPAIQLREKARTFWLEKLGPDAPETMAETRALELHFFVAGESYKALQIAEDLLARARRLYGRDSTNSLNVLYDYTAIIDQTGRHKEAVPFREEILEAFRKIYGSEHQETLRAINALEVSYYNIGLKEKARKLQEELMVLSPKVMGPEHPMTLNFLANQGVDYDNDGEHQKAINLLEPLLATERRVLGPEHPNTLFAMQTLSSAYFGAGRREEAVKMREEVLDLTRRVEGPEHPIMAFRTRHLAEAYAAVGRTNEALKLFEDALALSLKIFDLKHRGTAPTAYLLSNEYLKRGRIDDAIKAAEIALRSCREANPDAPQMAKCIQRLVVCYQAAKKPDKAAQIIEELIDFQTKAHGENHPDVVAAIASYADLLVAQWKWPEARQELLKCLGARTIAEEAHLPLMSLAALDVYLGENASYEAHRKLLLARFLSTTNASVADRIGKACLLLPVEGEDLRNAVSLTEKALELSPSSGFLHWFLWANALGKYRSSDYQGAAECARRSIVENKEEDISSLAPAHLILAMAYYKANKHEQGRAELAIGSQLVNEKLPSLNGENVQDWTNLLIAHILLREASEFIR